MSIFFTLHPQRQRSPSLSLWLLSNSARFPHPTPGCPCRSPYLATRTQNLVSLMMGKGESRNPTRPRWGVEEEPAFWPSCLRMFLEVQDLSVWLQFYVGQLP